jgi:hypothetical protein
LAVETARAEQQRLLDWDRRRRGGTIIFVAAVALLAHAWFYGARIGEAKNPGPDAVRESGAWTIGTEGPSRSHHGLSYGTAYEDKDFVHKITKRFPTHNATIPLHHYFKARQSADVLAASAWQQGAAAPVVGTMVAVRAEPLRRAADTRVVPRLLRGGEGCDLAWIWNSLKQVIRSRWKAVLMAVALPWSLGRGIPQQGRQHDSGRLLDHPQRHWEVLWALCRGVGDVRVGRRYPLVPRLHGLVVEPFSALRLARTSSTGGAAAAATGPP